MTPFSRNDHGDMQFSSEPTARGDEMADFMRQWYEANRETWWGRHRPNADRKGVHADEFMIGLMNEARRILDAAEIERPQSIITADTPVLLSKRPVAWRVKCFQEGWRIFRDEQKAVDCSERNSGALMQGLYARDGT